MTESNCADRRKSRIWRGLMAVLGGGLVVGPFALRAFGKDLLSQPIIDWWNTIAIVTVLIGALLFWHALLWRAITSGNDRIVKPIDLLWYVGSIVAVLLIVSEFVSLNSARLMDRAAANLERAEAALLTSEETITSALDSEVDAVLYPMIAICSEPPRDNRSVGAREFCERQLQGTSKEKLHAFCYFREYLDGNLEQLARSYPYEVGSFRMYHGRICKTLHVLRFLDDVGVKSVAPNEIRVEHSLAFADTSPLISPGQLKLIWKKNIASPQAGGAPEGKTSQASLEQRRYERFSKSWEEQMMVLREELAWMSVGGKETGYRLLDEWTDIINGESRLPPRIAEITESLDRRYVRWQPGHLRNEEPFRDFHEAIEGVDSVKSAQAQLARVRSALAAARETLARSSWHEGLWPFLLCVIIALRLCKTTSEVLAAYR